MNIFKRRPTRAEKALREKTRFSPDGLPITELPASYAKLIRLGDNVAGTYAAIYRAQHNVRVVVDDIAREAAELSIKTFEKIPRTPTQPSGRIVLPDHPMQLLLDEPVPGELEDEYGFWFKLFADLCIYDIAHWQVIERRGVPAALLRLPPQNLTPERDPLSFWVRGWRLPTGEVIPRNRVVTFWGFDPEVNHGSTSPMETLRRLLSEEVARDSNRSGMWRRSLRKDGVVEIAPDGRQLKDEARESWLIDAEDVLAGPNNSGRPLVLEPGWRWRESQFSPRDMEYLKARQMSRQEAASAFHMPPAKVAAAENGQQPDENTLKIFYQSTLPPYLSRVESVINAQLLPRFDQKDEVRRRRYVKFNLDEKLRGSFEERAAIMATTVGGPVATVNEGRTRLDLPPIDGFDSLYQPLNSVLAGGPQASPQNPVDTPATGVNPAGTTPGGGSQAPKSAEAVLQQFDEQREYTLKFEKFLGLHVEALKRHFSRQLNAARAHKSLQAERWDRELADDLVGIAIQAGEETPLRGQLGPIAKSINDQTHALYTDEEPSTFSEERAEQLARELTGRVMKR